MAEASESESTRDHELVGLQRAEFVRAAKWQRASRTFQWIIALIGVGSIFVSDLTITYLLAGLSLGLYVLYTAIVLKYLNSRQLAELARRATLLLDALGERMLPAERRALLARFASSVKEGKQNEDATYYASQTAPGPQRLAEMLEESAFWSSDLFHQSAIRTWVRLICFLAAAVAGLLSLPLLDHQVAISAARVVTTILVLFLSSDVLGAAMAYAAAANETKRVLDRLQRVKAAGYPASDVLLILGDYNSAVESAPLFVSGAYEARRETLNRLWLEHKGT